MTEAQVTELPEFDADGGGGLFMCESCVRYFEDDPMLQVGHSGSAVTCLHCFFNGYLEDLYVDFRDFIDAMTDMAGQPIGGVAGYVERCLALHDSEACPWQEMAGGCHLCDAAPGFDPRPQG
ncbi:hypothetical protein ENSA5_61990 [Enhygromyxa salina]|uniref:Uncharacterized protein n=2 Tax=Enhygromyxa salina TaxID=215803 RepID=A0A2S9XD36_9BACT|nr:hypothetical protein ENSA5_61990 [Enhygromyxa salina]